MSGACGVRVARLAVGVALVASALGLCGCVSPEIIIHRMPDQTPAADNAAAIAQRQKLAEAKQAEAKQAEAKRAETPAAADAPAPPVTPADAPPVRTYDPWERLNRFTYRFNARFDEAVFLPVANGYRRALPAPVRSGVHHFFGNLAEVDSVVNYLLQGRLRRSVHSLERFVINSTVGIGGLFDVAAKIPIPEEPTGFGTTLSQWGMHPGPYVVLPLLGPSTLREAVGLLGDYGTTYGINLANLYRGNVSYGLGTGNAIDERSNISFRYYSTGSPFEYENVRFLYVRKLLLEDAGLHKHAPAKPANPGEPAGE